MGKDGILVFCETDGGGALRSISLEALGLAGGLSASLGCEVAAAMRQCDAVSSVTGAAAKVFAFDAPPEGYRPEWYVACLKEICTQANPQAIIFGHTPLGQDVAARLAAGLGVGMVSDCVKVEAGPEGIVASKQIQGGIGVAAYSFKKSPRIVTVRPGAGTAPDGMKPGAGEIIRIDVKPDGADAAWELIENVCEECGEIRLEDAEIVVSGGRGMGGPEGFELVAELAKALNAAVGSSRPPCDLGWIKSSHQVGITGTIVSPKVYIAVGISGASQHLSGMSDSKTIVAVNKDAQADIFKTADYGVVGDFRQVLPAMIEKIKSMKKSGD